MDAAPSLPAEPLREAERHQALLAINNAIISNLTQEALFHAIAAALRRVVPLDRTAIFLHDPARDVLRLFVLESAWTSRYFVVGLEMPPGDSHVGWVFREGRPLLRRDLARERQWAMEDRALEDGVQSYVLVPVASRGRTLGVLAVASRQPGQYVPADAAFLQDAANQIALAIENMRAYEAVQAEMARRRRAEDRLRTVLEGTAAVTGEGFFNSLVRHVSAALGVPHAFLTECAGPGRARTLAFWKRDGFAGNFEYDTRVTPCMGVLRGEVKHYAAGVQALFPEDRDLADLGAESYLGIPVVDASGEVLGHLAVLGDQPLAEDPDTLAMLQVFAARAGAELRRLRAERDLQAALREVERLKNRLQAENVYLQEEIRREHDFVEMVGQSPALLAALQRIEQVAPTDSTVLILGETGTGKELVARAIHSHSARRERPLVKVNCSAISAGLVESELFGHVRGAFTGALERRLGRFQVADGGTVFLDEVGDLPPETQVKLLRVLQEREFEPVGSSQTVRVDVRVIAATNRDLEDAVRAGRFRADLFYRLNVLPLALPPLRERPGDIPLLAVFFLERFARRFGKAVTGIAPASLERLVRYPWPGNVRELQNVIERAVVLSRGPMLELGEDLLPLAVRPPGAPAGPAAAPAGAAGLITPEGAGAPSGLATLEDVERAHLSTVLERTGWVVEGPRGAARILGLHPNTLRSRLARLGIKRPPHDPS
jgi:transcriptional regulator with GAF, ATPase, and Fis domain